MESLVLRKLADKSVGERIRRYDMATGEAYLHNPANGQREGWPLAGVRIENEAGPPTAVRVSASKVAEGRTEGWIEVEGEEPVVRSAGPAENPWLLSHTFIHLDAVVFKTVDGDFRYEVTENPDKWPDDKDGNAGFGGEVRHFYDLKLVS